MLQLATLVASNDPLLAVWAYVCRVAECVHMEHAITVIMLSTTRRTTAWLCEMASPTATDHLVGCFSVCEDEQLVQKTGIYQAGSH